MTLVKSTHAPTLLCVVSIGSLLPHISARNVCAQELAAPSIMLANTYEQEDVELAGYWVSEKYDGVRAYWDGEKLLTRTGNVIRAPDSFIAGWPSEPLDGELWAGRGQFELLLATVRDQVPDESAWRQVRFMVFDLPSLPSRFTERLAALGELLLTRSASWRPVPHWRVEGQTELQAQLSDVVAAGGEGLMLHRGDSFYRAVRSDDLLKLKPYRDAEAEVIGYLPGKGKYEGMLGALEVKRPDGIIFRIGTGFTDEQRRHPPDLGTRVTYSYQGLTANGVPRFASFVRVRNE